MKFLSFAQGKKTYTVVVVGLVLGIIQGLDAAGVSHITIPFYVNWALGFLGLAALRSGVQAQSAKTTEDLALLVKDLLADTTVPTLGQPSPAGQTPAQAQAETASLNISQSKG